MTYRRIKTTIQIKHITTTTAENKFDISAAVISTVVRIATILSPLILQLTQHSEIEMN